MIDPKVRPANAVAWKYADPVEEARWIFDLGEAEEIAKEDPSLIVWLDCASIECDPDGSTRVLSFTADDVETVKPADMPLAYACDVIRNMPLDGVFDLMEATLEVAEQERKKENNNG